MHKGRGGGACRSVCRLRIVIAGGGTGGHLFPGIALAQEFLEKNPKSKILFVCTGNRLESSVLPEKGFQYKTITSEGIKGLGLFKKVISIVKIPKGIFESIRILKKIKPDIVVSMGSYSSGPVVMAASILGIKSVICEQNIVPGITNRILSCFVDRIYISFKDTRFKSCEKKIVFTGNPVRKEILNGEHTYSSQNKQQFTILIIGGSQGAHRINLAAAGAAKLLENKRDFLFIHQTGAEDEKQIRQTYKKYRISCIVEPFFNDMAKNYKKADLVICRAGATTIAEIMASGKPALLIPYPFAAGNHQVLNAVSLVKNGAAEMILEKDLSGKLMADKIEYYASNLNVLSAMASNAKKLSKPLAATDIVKDCYNLIKGVG